MRSSQIAQLYPHAPLAQGVACAFDFQSQIGTTVFDVSGNGNNGTWQGTLGSQWGPGKIGGGGVFNGIAYVVMPHVFNVSSTPFSLSAWIFPTATTEDPIIDDWSGLGGGFSFRFEVLSGQLSLQLRIPGNTDIFTGGLLSGGSIVPNQWQLVVATWYPLTKTGSIYINESLVASQVSTQSTVAILNTTNAWNIGRKQDSNTIFAGVVDEPTIWKGRALTPNDVQTLYAGSQGKAYPFT